MNNKKHFNNKDPVFYYDMATGHIAVSFIITVITAAAIKISSMAERIVRVKFGSLKFPLRSKLVTLPAAGTVGNRCDLLVLREILHREMLIDMSIICLGGTVNTPVEDVILSLYDDRFGQALDITSTTVLLDRANDIQVSLRPNFAILFVDSDEPGQKLTNSSPPSSLANQSN